MWVALEAAVSCKQIKFSVDFCRQLKLITSRLKISLTKTVLVNTARQVLKFSLSQLALPLRRRLKFLLLLLKTKKGLQTILSRSEQDLLNLLLFLCEYLHIVIKVWRFPRFVSSIYSVWRNALVNSELIWLKTGKATANKMTAKLN